MGSDTEDPPRKKRRGGEAGRDWKCEVDDCGKDFKSVRSDLLSIHNNPSPRKQKSALATHTNVTHLGRRDHVCPHDSCKRAYGYKHLLRRHLAKAHESQVSENGSSSDEEGDDFIKSKPTRSSTLLDIDSITGNAYAKRTRADVATSKALLCPYPHLGTLSNTGEQLIPASELGCKYAFSRAYDLRRHLKAVHNIVTSKVSVDSWVQERKK